MSGLPLGVHGAPPVGSVTESGGVQLSGVRATVRTWVGDERRWHTDGVAGRRRALVDRTPVLAERRKVAGGDARITSCAAVPAGGRAAVVLEELYNRTAAPLVVALVVGPLRRWEVTGDSLDSDGLSLRLSRPIADVYEATTVEALEAAVTAAHTSEVAEPTVVRSGSGPYVAVVVPVPHLQRARWAVVPGPGPAPDLDLLPPADAVVSGWTAHLGAEPAITAGWPVTAWWDLDRALASMDDPSPDWSAERTASWLAANGRMDARSDVDHVVEHLLRRQGVGGGWSGASPVETTLDALDGLVGLWRCGAPPEAVEQLLVPLVRAARWLERRRRWRADPARSAALLSEVSALLAAADQPDAGQALAELAAGMGTGAVAPVTRDEMGVPVAADTVGRLMAAERSLVRTLDGLVGPGPVIRLFDQWRPAWAGESADVRGVPTAWGKLGCSLRWHGPRPALLWEVDPWPSRAGLADPVLVAPTLDPQWRGSGRRGEALLAPVPAGEEVS